MAEHKSLLVNGRFLSRETTGVDRTATNLIKAMLNLREREAAILFDLAVAVPADAPPESEIRETLSLSPDCTIIRGTLTGYAWEQLELLFVQKDATLLSLCNTGPVLRSNQLALIHDAQVFSFPQSYSFAFRSVYKFLIPQLARRARWLATVSKFSRVRLRQYAIGEGREMAVIRNGVDHLNEITPDISILGREGLTAGHYLLAFDSAAKHKNVALLLDALKKRKGEPIPLVLVGSNNARVFGDAELSAGSNVQFAGRVTDAELCALYANARIFLLPSLTEGYGLPAGEAMSWGCPVIASTGGALSEIYQGAAMLIDPLNAEDWAEAIDDMVADDGLWQSWAERGRAHAAQNRWTDSALTLLKTIGVAEV